MMQIENRAFRSLYDRGDKLLLENMAFKRCEFSRCALSLTDQLDRISTVRNVELRYCSAIDCHMGPAVLSNVIVNGLATSDLFIIWCPYLDRVQLSGTIGRMKINTHARPSTFGNEKQQPFDEYRAAFYADVEWALDISEARFKEFDLRGVPSHLVRRDPDSQIIVTRERALQIATPGWETKLESLDTHWPFVINLFLSDGDPEIILVAPLAAPRAERDALLRALQEFRRIGLAEPD